MVMEIEQRIFEDAYKNARSNTEYSKQAERVIELGKKIMIHLGSNSLIFLEYESLVGLLQKIYLENTYYVGLEDGKNADSEESVMPNKMPNKNSKYTNTSLQ